MGTVLLFRCFCLGAVVSHSSLVSYVFCGVVLLCCAVFQFIATVWSVSLFFVLGSLLFQLGVRAFGGGLLTLRRFSTSSVILRRMNSECGFWCLVFWSGKFPIERCLWGWKSWSAVGVAMLVAVVFRCQGSATRSGPYRPSLGRVLLGESRTLLSDGLLDCCHPFVLTAWSVLALVSVKWFSWVVAACPVRWRLPSSFVMLLIGLIRCTGFCMPIWSFYNKTYIVIPTCTSDILPPVLPSLACYSCRFENWWAGVCGTWAAWRLLPDVRGRQQGYFPLVQREKCLMSVSGKMRVVWQYKFYYKNSI